MRRLLAPLLRPLLRRDPGEIARRAAPFRIDRPGGRELVSHLGDAFLRGYNAMLDAPSTRAVAEEGALVAPHFRPFFFEGAAMGYLPRGYLSPGFGVKTAEKDLVGMHPGFLYLYYVGLGFWFGMRHPSRPASLASLAPHLNPIYYPLCYDGFGFKAAFFDYPRERPGPLSRRTPRDRAWSLLEECPAEHRAAFHQGFGRALFFVFMDDEPGFRRLRDRLPPERRADFEQGRSLALAFTGIDRPLGLARHLASSADDGELAARLTGVTWALAAREMNDAAYFEQCLAAAPPKTQELLRLLPRICREALDGAPDYLAWQARTRSEALRAHAACRSSLSGEVP